MSGRLAVLLAAAALLAGCRLGGADRDALAAAIARDGGLAPAVAQTSSFALQVYRRGDDRPGPLVVYIEGDGAAYLDRRTVSTDPTPLDPLALRLAVRDPGPAVVYLGRPCQFAPGRSDRRCTEADWTTHRFSPEIVRAVDDALDGERTRFPQRLLVLVGYSGGGVIAALVAARRPDVALLITIAAPLDPADWTRRMNVSPLTGSDSPADHARELAGVAQVHFAGDKDRTVPLETARAYLARLGAARARLVVMPGFDHVCCWVQQWPQLRAAAERP